LEYALPLIEQDLDVLPSPALVMIWLGANDAALVDGISALQHVPVANYSSNLLEIVQRLRAKAPTANLMLATPTPVDDDHRRSLFAGWPDRTSKQAGVYAVACSEAASQANVTLLNLYTYFNSLGEGERNASLVDGLHFNSKGNRLVQEQIRSKIQSTFPELAAALATPQLPPWRELESWKKSSQQTKAT
jgi:lysophospholipase L1-like esterase